MIYTEEYEDYNEIKYEITYTWEGRYYPETRETPAEFPSANIIEVINLDSNESVEPTDEMYEYINSTHEE